MRRWWLAALTLVVLLTGLAGLVAVRDGRLDPEPTPSASPSPDPSRTPLLVPAGAEAPVPTAAGLRRALAAALKDPGLGSRVGASVVDVVTGASLLAAGETRAVTPASTTKIVTAVAALSVLPADRRFITTVVQGAPGDVVLVGAGDPTLAGRNAQRGFPVTARLSDLAAQLTGTVVKRVVVDDRLFTGPRLGPGWKPAYVTSGNVAPVSALVVDGGRRSSRKNQPRVADPALEAGRQLAALLHVNPVVRGAAPAGAAVLAQVSSPTVAELVEAMLSRSDNDLAEALGRQVALAMKRPASFDGEAAALATVVPGLRDASGLSPLNRLAPAAVTRVLVRAATEPRLGPVLSGLPVAGFDGTLSDRYRKAPTLAAAGEVRAKTGTLNGVSALAGLVRTRSGRLLAFDLAADGVPIGRTQLAQAALDRVATALASCGCT